MKLDMKDYIGIITAAITVGSVVWKGGQISAELESTNNAVRALTPVVQRLDATTAKLEAAADSNKSRLDDLTRRVEIIDSRVRARP
jgi:hypothetical protein